MLGDRSNRRWSSVGSQKAFYPEGELATARAAKAKKTTQMLSTVTSVPVEEVAKALGAPPWFQLYMPLTWNETERLVKRVEDAGCPVLAWTIDLLAGRNTETGFNLIHLAGILQLCRRPRHLLRFLAFALKFDAPILISTPNLDSDDLRLLGPAWCHWDPQRTCFIYGAQSLRALMRHCGFEEKILISFSHSSWKAASRRNLANAVHPADIVAKSSFVEELPLPSKSKNQSPSGDLEGDFLIGLFNRKL